MTDELTKGVPEDQNPQKPGAHPIHDPAYPDHKSFPGLPSHFSLLSAQASGSPHNPSAHDSLFQDLTTMGFRPLSLKAHYGADEECFIVAHRGTEEDHKKVEDAAWKYGQSSVAHSSEGKNKIVSRHKGKEWSGEGVSHGPHLHSNFTVLPTGHRFQLNIEEAVKKSEEKDPYEILEEKKKEENEKIGTPHHYGVILGVNVFHAIHDSQDSLVGIHVTDPTDDEIEAAIEQAQKENQPAVIIHGNPPPVLRDEAPPGPHPHAYDWYDCNPEVLAQTDDEEKDHTEGNGIFYSNAGPDGIGKAELALNPTGHSTRPSPVDEHHFGDSQKGSKGASTYLPIAEHFGMVMPRHESNLQFYRGIEKDEAKIDALIAKKNFQVYFAGGNSGAPDVDKKNYLTGYLMIWSNRPDLCPDDELYFRCWRKLHELAHGMTLKDVDKLYGEGLRVGQLGVITPREAKRAVQWEWLAVEKQRDLSQKAGIEISDEDFNRESNTVMHDAVHRVLTGNFVDASQEGFAPSPERIPLEVCLRIIDEHAMKIGLNHEDAMFRNSGIPSDITQGFQNMIKSTEGEIKKAFLQGDGETLTDPKSHDAASTACPKWLMEWGTKNLVPMGKDEHGDFVLGGKIIKVRKLLEDLYTGWIEDKGQIIHNFEKITLPLVLSQLQSKLELYGNEQSGVEENKESTLMNDSIKQGKDIGQIGEKLKELQQKVDTIISAEAEHKESITGKELSEGIENPEKECSACERAVSQCVCYTNMPKPRIEVSEKGINIFFKAEWQEEDIANFKNDLIKRAGIVLQQRRLDRAKDTLSKIRKGIK